MKKNDIILIAAVFSIAAIFFAIHFLGNKTESGIVEVQVDGELYGTYSLEEEQQIDIDKTNQLEIEDGTVSVTWADCPDQVCVKHKPISRDGESIICLPNKIVISIVDGLDSELDAIVN